MSIDNTGRPGPAARVLNPGQANPLLRYEFDRGSNYEVDTRLTQALSALVPEDELHSADHRFFQVLHLVTEYAWVAIHHTLCDVDRRLAEGEYTQSRRSLDRCAGLARIPVDSVRELIHSLSQDGLLRMRELFPANTTGLDSPGARNLRRACTAVWNRFESVLAELGVTPMQLVKAASVNFRNDERMAMLSDVLYSMQRFDSVVVEWKQVHLQMVWMLIGGQPFATEAEAESRDDAGPSSLRGRPISDLERMAMRPMFPKLWSLSTSVFHEQVTEPSEELAQ